MLTIQSIEKTYEGQPLLKKVSFTIQNDETVCLLGSSGSGKSTLLRIIAGLEQAESGQVTWNGKDLTNVPVHQREFGLMFQDYALFPHRNVSENIAFGLRMQGLAKDEIQKKVDAALETIHMTNFAKRKVTELSGGEQQRVALARALAPEPRLLMLDEPLGALDRTLREQLSRELRRILRETKIPAIYVTHDQEEAFAIADRLLLLHDGVILQDGKPHEIYHHPKNVWVARFFGLGNLVPGQVVNREPLTIQTPLGSFLACESSASTPQSETTLLFRPGQAQLSDNNEGTNQITGQVTDQVFQGERYLVTMKINETQPNFQVLLQKPHTIGETLTVFYQPEALLCLENGKEKA
ncbi:MAG: ABC transporter ATP-binding protein [Anaerolineaceae bacterium]|nr:ABC transporter ATP-binding protein [Anaerolineaceae bacterium]